MNWTGGRLSRHPGNAKDSLTQKQKQYFAKVRNKSQNEKHNRSPHEWSLFGNDQTTHEHQLADQYSATLCAFNSAENCAKYNLSGAMKGGKNHLEGFGSKTSASTTTHKATSPCRKPSLYKGSLLNHYSFNSRGQHRSNSPPKSKCKLPSWAFQRKGSTLGQWAKEEEESLGSRRQKLLGKRDWVGADIQRPLKLKYMTSTSNGEIGKRRKVNPDEKGFSVILQPKISSPFDASKRKSTIHGVIPSHRNKEVGRSGWIAEPRSRVRISIGGKHKHVGVTSSTSQYKQPKDHHVPSSASTSDVMLLDGEESGKQYGIHSRITEGQYSNLFLPLFPDSVAGRIHAPPVNTYQEESITYGRFSLPHQLRIHPLSIHSEDRVSLSTAGTSARNRLKVNEFQVMKEVDHHPISSNFEPLTGEIHYAKSRRSYMEIPPHFTLGKLHNLDVQRFEDVTNLQVPESSGIYHGRARQRSSSPQEEYLTNLSRQFSSSTRKLHSVARDKARKLPHFSAGPQLLHPIPQYSRKPPVLRTVSTENEDSIVAQLGATKHVIHSSQLLDEEMWKTFMLSLDDEDVENQSEVLGSHKILFSPSISAIAHPVTRSSPLLLTAQEENATLVTKGNGRESQLNHKIEDQNSKQNCEDELPVPCNNINHRKQDNYLQEEFPSALTALDYKNNFLSRPKHTQTLPKAVSQPNPDEAWMKFILSDSFENNQNSHVHSASHTTKNLRKFHTLIPPESSLLGQISTESTSNIQSNSIHSIIYSSASSPKATTTSTIAIGRNCGTSSHSTRGSVLLPSSNRIHKTIIHRSNHPLPSSSDECLPQNLPAPRKITFRKPRRFASRKHGRSYSPDEVAGEEEPSLHIESMRNISGERDQDSSGTGRKVRRMKDVYSLSSSEGDDVESIEDD